MREYSWCEGWTFRHVGEESYSPVLIPHDGMLGEERLSDAPSGVNGCWFVGRDYEYRKEFFVNEEYREQSVVMRFEGIYHNAEIFMNDVKICERPYGYSCIDVDCDGFLKYGQKNVVRVLAHNSDQPNSRWYSGAGIYRPVSVLVAPKFHILPDGISIHTISLSPTVIHIKVETNALGSVYIEINDKNGNLLGSGCSNAQDNGCSFAAEMEIDLTNKNASVPLWSPDSPELVTANVRFGSDAAKVNFGVRTVQWGKDGLLINGERVIIRGACIHHDNGILGAAGFQDAEERKVRLLKENGYNAIRSAHNPISRAILDSCDRMGIMVMDELTDCWYIHKTKHDYVSIFEKWWKKDTEDMVRKDYCHPCVVGYSIGNEVSETAQKKGIELTEEMVNFIHSLDSTRFVTCGVNIFFNFLSSMGFGVYSDEKAEKEAAAGEKKKAVGSEFFNNLAGKLGDNVMKIGATLPPCDWKTKGAFSKMDIAGYNYGIRRYRHDLKKYPDRLILGSETFCNDASSFYELAEKEPRIIGDFVWAGIDYLGEVGVGSWEYEDYAPDFSHGVGWITAGSGRIDLTGKPLAESSYTRVAFGMEKNPVIAVRPVNHTHSRHSPSAWKMTNAIESWTWNGCEGKDATVEVFSKGDSVEIFINGMSQGKKKTEKMPDNVPSEI